MTGSEDHLPLNSPITPGRLRMFSKGEDQMGDGNGSRGTRGDGLSAPCSEDAHGRSLLRYTLGQDRRGGCTA